MTTTQEYRISRAAIRRLSHDAQQKFSKDSYEGALEELNRFLSTVLRVSQRAAIFSRKKAVAREHVLYALDSLRVHVPTEIRALDAEGLSKLQRCNPKAPAHQRKRSALHVEVSEAAFGRLTKRVAKTNGAPSRISSQARRILQLVAEQHIMVFFADAKESKGDSLTRDALTAEALQTVCACTSDVAESLTVFLNEVLDRIPPLLGISQTKTIDDRLLKAVFASMCADLGPSDQEGDAVEVSEVDQRLARLCDRILRGRAADKRIAASASLFLARAIAELRDNATRRECSGRYDMRAPFEPANMLVDADEH